MVEHLDLPLLSLGGAMLADGSVEKLRIYRVRAIWHGRRRSTRSYEAAGGPLVGMAPLRGSRLRVDVVPGGSVVVEELT